jgi:hypothetical protein
VSKLWQTNLIGYGWTRKFEKGFSREAVIDLSRCCIDKTSSAELSEAINSMFRWYEKAETCYAYLSDVPDGAGLVPAQVRARFAASRWFTRGWTLQELIAPRYVLFFSRHWKYFGTKESLCDQISAITGIDTDTLLGAGLEHVSVARKMSWASCRNTTRIEDSAYCLLGLFDVNMPLLYGEGQKAFQRLQEEILRSSHDYSLFAWGLNPRGMLDLGEFAVAERGKSTSSGQLTAEPHTEEPPLRGLLASSPAEFESSRNVEPSSSAARFYLSEVPPVIHNRSVYIDFLMIDLEEDLNLSIAVLGYRPEAQSRGYIGLVLKHWGNELFRGRMQEPVFIKCKSIDLDGLQEHQNYLPSAIGKKALRFIQGRGDIFSASTQRLRIKEEPRLEILEGCFTMKYLPSREGCQLGMVYCAPGARYDRRNRVLWPNLRTTGPQAVFNFIMPEFGDRFVVVLARDKESKKTWAYASRVTGPFKVDHVFAGHINPIPGLQDLKVSEEGSVKISINDGADLFVQITTAPRKNTVMQDVSISISFKYQGNLEYNESNSMITWDSAQETN